MEALDNPFYFSVLGGNPETRDSAVSLTPRTGEARYCNVLKDSPPLGKRPKPGSTSSKWPKEEPLPLRRTRDDCGSPRKVRDENRRQSLGSSWTRPARNYLQYHQQQVMMTRASRTKLNSEQPSVDAGTRTESTRGNSPDMLDILIVSSRLSEAAGLWVSYLTSCFHQISREEQRAPFKMDSISLEDVMSGMSIDTSASRLQIVVTCPVFMEALDSNPGAGMLAGMVQPATVIAMLLGVTAQQLDSHRLSSVFHFEQWRRMTVKDQDASFVGDFLGVSMDILSRSWQLQQAMSQVKMDSSQAQFSITPKKIKMGQNKLLILFNDPLSANDKVVITVDRNGTKSEVSSYKKRNPFTIQFSMPVSCLQTSTLVSITVEKNGRLLGQRMVKCESKLRELEQLLRTSDNPVLFMCQSLGLSIADREQLDHLLVSSLQKNIPPNFSLLNVSLNRSITSSEEYPTLLHFGARFGLEKLCWQLLECPGGEQATQIKNSNNLTPAEIADKNGHARLAQALKGFAQMTELSSMYNYLKGISEKPQVLDEANYLLPRPVNDTYSVPPAARPVLGPIPPSPSDLYKVPVSPVLPVPMDYQVPHSNRPCYFPPATPSPTSPHSFFSSYLQMNSPTSPVSKFDIDFLGGRQRTSSSMSGSDQISINSEKRCPSAASSVSGKMSPQDELIEIINDFKNNVFTIGEVEKLVDAWRNRNDVQQSFKEKQDQLEQMRQEYDRIQKTMKDQMKRATPFERVKKFFSRKHKNGTDLAVKGSRASVDLGCHRPVSSLSLQSTCSSSSTGKVSTGSGVSLGDSGTHSDPDDHRGDLKMVGGQEFSFHQTLQSVRERSEHSGSSLADDYVTSVGYLPQPPGTKKRTVVQVQMHRSNIPSSDDESSVPKNEVNNNTPHKSADYVNSEIFPTSSEETYESAFIDEVEKVGLNLVDSIDEDKDTMSLSEYFQDGSESKKPALTEEPIIEESNTSNVGEVEEESENPSGEEITQDTTESTLCQDRIDETYISEDEQSNERMEQNENDFDQTTETERNSCSALEELETTIAMEDEEGKREEASESTSETMSPDTPSPDDVPMGICLEGTLRNDSEESTIDVVDSRECSVPRLNIPDYVNVEVNVSTDTCSESFTEFQELTIDPVQPHVKPEGITQASPIKETAIISPDLDKVDDLETEMYNLKKSEQLLRDMADGLINLKINTFVSSQIDEVIHKSLELSMVREDVSRGNGDSEVLNTILADPFLPAVPDYVNVSPLATPPLPTKTKHKSVIL